MFEIGKLYAFHNYDYIILIISDYLNCNEFHKCFTFSFKTDTCYDSGVVYKSSYSSYKELIYLNDLTFNAFKLKIEEIKKLQIFK